MPQAQNSKNGWFNWVQWAPNLKNWEESLLQTQKHDGVVPDVWMRKQDGVRRIENKMALTLQIEALPKPSASVWSPGRLPQAVPTPRAAMWMGIGSIFKNDWLKMAQDSRK